MRVEDDVRDNSRLREGHVDQRPFLTAYSFLASTAGKLVTNYGISLSKFEVDALIAAMLATFQPLMHTRMHTHMHTRMHAHTPQSSV